MPSATGDGPSARRPWPIPEVAALVVDLDTDYVDAYRRFIDASLELRESGSSPQRLLEHSRAAFLLGDHLQSLRDAEEAARLAPEDAEAQFQRGLAALAVAAVRAGTMPTGPGLPGGGDPPLALVEALRTARAAFLEAVRLHPQDAEARRAAETASVLLVLARRREAQEP